MDDDAVFGEPVLGAPAGIRRVSLFLADALRPPLRSFFTLGGAWSPLVARLDVLDKLSKILHPGERKETPRYVLAGGWLRAAFSKETTRDIDLFFHTRAERDAVAEALLAGYSFCRAPVEIVKAPDPAPPEPHAVKLIAPGGQAWDLVYREDRDTPAKVIGEFDLTCCACAYDPANTLLYFHERFREDAKNRILRMLNPMNGVSSLLHAMRLARRGFEFPDREEAKRALLRWADVVDCGGKGDQSSEPTLPEEARGSDRLPDMSDGFPYSEDEIIRS